MPSHFAVPLKSDNYRYCECWKGDNFKKIIKKKYEKKLKKNVTKNGAKKLGAISFTIRWKSDNHVEGNREKSNIVVAILEN